MKKEQNNNQVREGKYVSEFSPRQKKHFYIALGMLVAGFLFLWSIGSAINDKPYLIRAFLAPFLVLCSIVYIPYGLYKKK